MIPKTVLEQRGTYWENRIKVFLAEDVPENPVVFIGDSLTERFAVEKYFGPGFINRGIGGDHADGLFERRELMALDKNPKAVFLMVGINDLLFDYQRDQIPQNIEKILTYIKEKVSNCDLFIQSICPVKNWDTTSPAEITAINRELRELAAKLGATYIDLYPHFADENGFMREEYTIDGVHLSEKGNDLWASLLGEYIKPYKS
mgnify:CR=1 FL=1